MEMKYLVFVLAIISLIVCTAVHANALTAREIRFTPATNYPNGTVIISVPQSFLGSFNDLYVSDTRDCANILTTDWINVGGTIYIIFNTTKQLETGKQYIYYLCYGDIEVPHPQIWRDPTNYPYIAVNATLQTNGVKIHIDNKKKLSYGFASGTSTTTINVYNNLLGEGYITKTNITITTTINQTYYATLLGKTYTLIYQGASAGINITQNYDTGTHYYDTGIYTIKDFGREIAVTRGKIEINVYDSDRDTYYVYLYIDGRQVQRWYQQDRITYDLSGKRFRTIAVRVYDTERNDWVRAWGTLYVSTQKFIYGVNISINEWASGQIKTVISAANAFTANATVAIEYYPPVEKCGYVLIGDQSSQFFMYLRNLGFNGFVLNATIMPSNASDTIILYNNSIVFLYVGESSEDIQLSSNNNLGSFPSYISVDDLESGYTKTIHDDEALRSPGSLYIKLCVKSGPPGDYGISWSEARLYPALYNYTGLFIGASYTPGSGGGNSGGGSGAGNTTIIVQPSPYEEKQYIIEKSLLTIGLFGLAVFFFFVALRTNSIVYAVLAFMAAIADSYINFALQEYKVAKFMAVVATALVLYPVLERMIDIILEALRGRIRHPY